MKKKIKITKSQKDNINELNVVADTGATGGNINQAVQNAQNTAKQSGVRNASVVIPPKNEGKKAKPVMEKVLSKKEIESMRIKVLKENAKRFTKAQLDEMLKLGSKKKELNENFSDLKQLGIFELADSIVSAKEQFSDLVYRLFDTLHDKGYKFNDIVKVVNKMQLDGLIPKTMMNKISNNYKAIEKEQKETAKMQKTNQPTKE